MTVSKRIIIIGAGMAGLAAGARLSALGYDTLILEARDRCGGRIMTDLSLGIPVGSGANFIHGIDDNPITQLAMQFQATPTVIDSSNVLRFDKQGQLISSNEAETFNQKMDAYLQLSKKIVFQTDKDQSLADVLSTLINFNEFSSHETDLFQLKLRYFEGYIGADYQSLSAKYWDQEEVWPGAHCYLANSYQPIVDGLAEKCRVKLNTVVEKIKKRLNDVEIETSNGLYYADAVLVTLPLGVLKQKSVQFDPPLPSEKEQAIFNLGMGLLNIAGIKFSSAFWPPETQAMYFTQFDDLSIPIFFSLMPMTKQPILLGFCGGERAKRIEALTNKQVMQKIIDNFHSVFGTHLPNPDGFFISRWHSDPFSYGSYSYLATGASVEDYNVLAQPIDDWLFFAGEATCGKYLATTHGAYLSGLREAENIRNLR